MDRLEIINRIGYIRVKAKLTQKALSVAIGMNPSYINRLESRKNFLPSLEVLMRIIEECGSTEEEFFSTDIVNFAKNKEFADKVLSLPEDTRQFILTCDPTLMELFCKVNERGVKLDRK